MTVALTYAAAVAGTVATTAPPFSARMTTAATTSVSFTMPTTTATSSTTAPTGLQAVGRSPCRRRGHTNGGDNSAALQRPHDNDGDGVGVGDIVNHEGNAVDVGADEERQPLVTFHVVAVVSANSVAIYDRGLVQRKGEAAGIPLGPPDSWQPLGRRTQEHTRRLRSRRTHVLRRHAHLHVEASTELLNHDQNYWTNCFLAMIDCSHTCGQLFTKSFSA